MDSVGWQASDKLLGSKSPDQNIIPRRRKHQATRARSRRMKIVLGITTVTGNATRCAPQRSQRASRSPEFPDSLLQDWFFGQGMNEVLKLQGNQSPPATFQAMHSLLPFWCLMKWWQWLFHWQFTYSSAIAVWEGFEHLQLPMQLCSTSRTWRGWQRSSLDMGDGGINWWPVRASCA